MDKRPEAPDTTPLVLTEGKQGKQCNYEDPMVTLSNHIIRNDLTVKVVPPSSDKMWKNSATSEPTDHKPSNKPRNKPRINLSQQKTNLAPLTIYHQNIRGLRGKTDTLLCLFHPTLPHILFLRASHEPLGITAYNYQQL
jgi:hypothetical protein